MTSSLPGRYLVAAGRRPAAYVLDADAGRARRLVEHAAMEFIALLREVEHGEFTIR